jgi:hypothetical protein
MVRLIPLPVTLAREYRVTPPVATVAQGTMAQRVDFTVQRTTAGEADLNQVLVLFRRPGETRERPFFTQKLSVDWSFIGPGTKTTTGSQPTGMTGPGLPDGPTPSEERPQAVVPEDLTDNIDGGTSADELRRMQALLRALRAKGLAEGIEALRDERLRRFLMLRAATQQHETADVEGEIPIMENQPDIQPPPEGETGSYECSIEAAGPEIEPEPNKPPSVDQIDITRVVAVRRGCYEIHFRYYINDCTNRTPLTFDCLLRGSDNQWVSQIPWQHRSPDSNWQQNGVIELFIDDVAAPLSLGPTQFKVRALGKKGKVLQTVTATPPFAWCKAYASITRDNLVDYFADPASPSSMTRTRINEGDNSLRRQAGAYAEEPPMMCFQTSEGTYARGFLKAHRGGQGVEGAWVVDLDCFLGAPPYFIQGHKPADDSDWWGGMMSYDLAGMMTLGVQFDLDWRGFNCTPAEADLALKMNDDGEFVLTAQNGCEMKY